MSALVDYGKHGTLKIVLMEMVCDAHIMIVEVGGERVRALRHNAARKIKTNVFSEEAAEFLLLIDWKFLVIIFFVHRVVDRNHLF